MAVEEKAAVAVDSLTDEQAGDIFRLFGFEPDSLVRLYGGYASSNFKATGRRSGDTGAQTRLLKINHYSIAVEDLDHQIYVMNHMKAVKFPTNYPHASPSGSFLVEGHDRRAMLLDFVDNAVPGSELLTREESKAPKILSELSSALAQLHLVTWPSGRTLRDVRSGYPVCNMGDLLKGEELDRLEADPAFASHELIKLLRQNADWLRELYSRELPRGLIHGDGFLDNTLYESGPAGSADCRLLALIDWEDSCVGPFVLDVAVCASAVCFTASNDLIAERLRTVLAAYQAQRPLSEAERASLADFMASGALACAFYRFCEFNVRQPESDAKAKDSWRIMYERAKIIRAGKINGVVTAALEPVAG